MGSSRGNCEIVEANDEPTTIKPPQTFRQVRGQDRERKPPNPKKGPNKSLNDDINKLFESVNLRTSKSLDLSDSWRNASKRPMKGTTGNHSPRIGFSEPVSLKQALRGMCISQAAEMAALKRLSMPSTSPRMSEAGKITNLYTSVGESRMKNSVMTEESTSYSSEASSRSNQYYDSSPAFCATQDMKSIKCVPDEPGSGYSIGMSFVEGGNSNCSTSNITPTAEVDIQLDENVCSKEEKHDLVPHHNVHDDDVLKSHKKMSGLNKVASGVSKDCASKAAPKPRQKSRLQTVTSSTAVKSNKDIKSTKNTSRAVKPVIRNKNLVIKKSKKVAVSADNSDTSYEVSSEQMICQRCQCSLKDTNNDSSKDPPTTTSVQAFTDSRKCEASKSDLIPSNPVVNTIMTSKSSEKGDISQSSKSSICDFSSSTTSLSDESNLSGPTCGNRPHMSKDVRWGAISFIGKRYGFLGLNHFNLLKKLGCGDIGTVYLAELIGTNCLFAIKVMDNEFLGKRKKMVRAQTEREILRMLDHPFLPTLYAQFTSDNLSCYVMEFCPGGDLHVLRQKQPGRYFPEQEARFYVAEVLLALEYLHMLGIVYRDLKPENILVREDGHIMLTDFDLSLRCSVSPILVKSSSSTTEPPRVSGPCAGSNCIDPFCAGPSCQVSCFSPRLLHTNAKARKVKADAIAQARLLPMLVAEPTEARSNSFVGTHEYLAPEIIKGEGHGSAVDWWTFGVFLYELLYGKTPFKGVENEETLTNVVLQNLKFPDSPMVSFQARDLIRGLLVKEPENRLGTEMGAAEIKRHPFFEGLNWALIRCAVPPQIPEFFDVESSGRESHEEGVKFVEYNGNGHPLEFELF